MLDIKGIYLGVATASSQIEGGEVGSNWNAYSDAGKITDGSNVKRAADHWNRYEEDIAFMKELGVKHYRMSLEWSRLEPVQGQFDDAAFEHYRKEIQLMKDLGIHVLLTFYHFSHPIWFEDLKSFEKEANIPIFLAYVQEVIWWMIIALSMNPMSMRSIPIFWPNGSTKKKTSSRQLRSSVSLRPATFSFTSGFTTIIENRIWVL